jgi:hypothetical protein
MGIKSIIMILASLSFSVTAFAQGMENESGEKKPFSVYGDFATSLQFHDNENANSAGNHDDFNVNLAEINFEKNWSNSRFHMSVGFGSTATAVSPATAATNNTLNLLNGYYELKSSYGLIFTVGKMESIIGHETYTQMDNSQFTRSYGFSLAPFFQTGAMVKYAQDMWNVGLVVDNGAGQTTDTKDNNKTMSLVAEVNPMENLSFDINYLTGTEGTAASTQAVLVTNTVTVLDISAAYMINEMFDVALNYIAGSQKSTAAASTQLDSSSIAAYVNANLGMFGLGLRYEQFQYDNGFTTYNGPGAALPATTGNDNKISAITVTAKAEIDQNALVMLEYRMDSSDDKIWTEKDGTTATDAQNTITAALLYRF